MLTEPVFMGQKCVNDLAPQLPAVDLERPQNPNIQPGVFSMFKAAF